MGLEGVHQGSKGHPHHPKTFYFVWGWMGLSGALRIPLLGFRWGWMGLGGALSGSLWMKGQCLFYFLFLVFVFVFALVGESYGFASAVYSFLG